MYGTGMMGMQEHPFLTKFKERVPYVIQQLVAMGQMTPQEGGIVQQMINGFGPGTQLFVKSLIGRYQNIDDPTMDQQIMTVLIPNVRVAARSRMASPYGMGGGAGAYGMGGGGGGFGLPSAFAPQVNNQPANLFGSPATPPTFGSVPTATTTPAPNNPVDLQLQKKEPAVLKDAKWEHPKMVAERPNVVTLFGVANAALDDFVDSNGDLIRRVTVYDPRIRYADDHDAIRAYKHAFNIGRKPSHRFLTIAYRQLRPIQVGNEEFTKMANAVSTELLKCNGDVETKLRVMIHTLGNFKTTANCMNEYVKLFCDELDAQCQCGALVDGAHPTMVMGKFSTLEQVLDLVTGDFDKDTLKALHNMAGFKERLELVVGRLIDAFFAQLPKFILHPDPVSDPTTIDDLSRVLPALWSSDGQSLRGTDDLFDTFIVSKTVIEGSRTDTAIKKESELQDRLNDLNKNFTVLFVNRIVSWCDYSVSDLVKYDPNDGSCIPTVFDQNFQFNDPSHFINEVIVGGEKSRHTDLRRSPRTLYCEFEETTTELQYGVTTDNKVIILSTKGWK